MLSRTFNSLSMYFSNFNSSNSFHKLIIFATESIQNLWEAIFIPSNYLGVLKLIICTRETCLDLSKVANSHIYLALNLLSFLLSPSFLPL